jgi:hypothetical protein
MINEAGGAFGETLLSGGDFRAVATQNAGRLRGRSIGIDGRVHM